MSRFFRFLALVGLSVVCTLDIGLAQQPAQAQRDAIRSACRSDFITNCSGVQPGGKDALDCLTRHSAKLSSSCKVAVEAVSPTQQVTPAKIEPAAPAAPTAKSEPPPASRAPAGAQSQEDQLKAVRQVCTLNDFMSHCSWIAPTNPELLLCLKGNASELSPACQAVVQSLPAASMPAIVENPPKETQQSSPVGAVESKPEAPAPTKAQSPPVAPHEAAVSQKPGTQQMNAIRSDCRSDFIAYCRGVQPGGTAALRCLQRNEKQLVAACKSALAAIASTAPTESHGAPAAAPETPAVAQIGPVPRLSRREAIALLRSCGADQRALCAGVPLGGGHVISCLAENAAALSPGCYDALRAAARR